LGYFSNIAVAAKTIFEGLAITASHMFRRPITVQYPDKIDAPLEELIDPRYRGLLDVDLSVCIACKLCEKACPINCIGVGLEKGEGSSRFLTKFDIDAGLCMFCGFCAEACPTGAIHFTRKFEGATPNLDELIFKFIKEGDKIVPYKRS